MASRIANGTSDYKASDEGSRQDHCQVAFVIPDEELAVGAVVKLVDRVGKFPDVPLRELTFELFDVVSQFALV
jgi:hypothetical protein